MSYNPYANYAKKKLEDVRKTEQENTLKDMDRRKVCDGVITEKISKDVLRKMIRDTRGQGLCFTEPGNCSSGLERKIDGDKETLKERIADADPNNYYYK